MRCKFREYRSSFSRVLGFPVIIIPTHWDNYILPYQASKEELVKKLDPFIKEITTASPKTHIIVPKYFEPIVLEMRSR
jgi:hypothetical protein